MIFWFLWMLIVSLFAAPAEAGDSTIRGDGGGGGGIVSTMDGNRLTDESLALIYNLGSFVSPPSYPKVYFSTDEADTGLPVGNDSTGDGSKSAPFRTIEKAVEITNQGYVEIVWDCEDTWDSTGDFGTVPSGGFVVNMPCTDLEDDFCVIWSSTDPTGQCRWTQDWDARGENTTNALYGWTDSEETWWGVQNGRVLNWPPTPAADGDMFRSDGSSAEQHVLVMNFEAPNLQGQNNQYRTSHGLTDFGANFVSINVDATCQDRTGNVATTGATTINVVKAGAGTCPAGGGDCLQGPDWVAEGFTDALTTVALTGFSNAENNTDADSVSVDSTNMILAETDLVSESGDGDEEVEEEYGCQIIHDTGDSNVLVLGGTWTQANPDTTYIHGGPNAIIIGPNNPEPETVIVGATLRDINAPADAEQARRGVEIPGQNNSNVVSVIANTTISGIQDGAGNDQQVQTIVAGANSNLVVTHDMRLYRVSFRDVGNWVVSRSGDTGSRLDFFGRCLAGDTTVGDIIHLVSSSPCSRVDYDFRAVYFDDTANPSFRGGSMGDKNTAADFVTDSVAAGCNDGNGFTEWGTDADSVSSSTSPFLSGTSICDADTDCFESCPYDFVYDFRSIELPASVFGRSVTGIHLGTSDKKNIGN